MIRFTGTVKYDSITGDHYLEFPPELLDQMGWNIGDTLIWKDNGDGSFAIKKKMGDSTGDQETNEDPDGTSENTPNRDP